MKPTSGPVRAGQSIDACGLLGDGYAIFIKQSIWLNYRKTRGKIVTFDGGTVDFLIVWLVGRRIINYFRGFAPSI